MGTSPQQARSKENADESESTRKRPSSQKDRGGVARPDQPDKPPTAESGEAPVPPPSSARPVRPNGEGQSGDSPNDSSD